MAEGRTKVFISWSGDLSKQVATVWRDLVARLFDNVVPFMSEQDVGAGTRGLPTIAAELEDTQFGIVVVTQGNQTSQWLNYEAGAISKNVSDPTVRVAPSLVDFTRKSDATGPLGQFQGTLLDHDGIEAILVEIAKTAGAPDVATIRERFEWAWNGEYEARFRAASEPAKERSKHRETDEYLDEILNIVRGVSLTVGASSAPVHQRFSLPLDIPLDKIREVIEESLGADNNVPVRLSVNENGHPQLVFQLGDWPSAVNFMEFGDELFRRTGVFSMFTTDTVGPPKP